MAAGPPTSLSLSLDTTLQPLHFRSSSSSSPSSPPSLTFPSSYPSSHPFRSLHKSHLSILKFLNHFSSPPTPPHATLDSSPRPGTPPFLDEKGKARLETLKNFHITHKIDHGLLEIRPMVDEELDPTVQLLAESFAEAMWMPASRYVSLLTFLVRQYVLERSTLIPHTAILVGFYKDKDGVDAQLACTAEVSFDELGMNVSPPTPLPPRNRPYICNMTVKKMLRRRRIGSHLLKTCEMLISQMTTAREVYLHCRVTDTGPYHMYKKAGYKVVKTDNILIWLTLQRRKYLMCKELQVSDESQPDARSDEFPHAPQ